MSRKIGESKKDQMVSWNRKERSRNDEGESAELEENVAAVAEMLTIIRVS